MTAVGIAFNRTACATAESTTRGQKRADHRKHSGGVPVRGVCTDQCDDTEFVTLGVCVYYCRTFYKAVRVGEEESGGHVL